MGLPLQTINWAHLRRDFRSICKERKVDQKAAADFMSAPPSMVFRFLNGKTVSADNFMLLCWWMEVEANDYSLL